MDIGPVNPEAGGGVLRSPGVDWLRQLAGAYYTTNQRGVTVPDMQKMDPFNVMSLRTLERWCIEDEWVNRRQTYFQAIRVEIERKIGTKLVQTRFRQLQTLGKIMEDVEKRFGKGLRAGTLEGLLSAYLKGVGVIDQLRVSISNEIVPENLGGVANQGELPVKANITDEEAFLAAQTILQRRQQATKGVSLQAPEDDDDDDEEKK